MPAAAAPPSPHGALTTEVVCRTERDGDSVRHPLILHPDWSADTGHDLEAERVAAAFGAYSSCLDLVNRVMPALRFATQLWTRTALAPIAPTRSARWRLTDTCRCPDRRDTYDRPEQAASHARSISHLARSLGVSSLELAKLLRAVSEAYGDLTTPPTAYDPHLLTAEATALRLWDAGISPALASGLHRGLRARGALTFRSYALAAHSDFDAEYLHSILRVAGSPDAVEWALSTVEDFDQIAPSERAAWLGLGVSRREAADLMRVSYPVQSAEALALALDVVPLYAASVLASWARSGLAPAIPELVRLHEMRGAEWYAPTPHALAPFRQAIERSELSATATQVALILAACGGAARATRALRLGVRSLTDLDRVSLIG